MKVLLIATYELDRQPFGLASPAAWLKDADFEVSSLDLSRRALDEKAVEQADLIALHLPMHTATRLAVPLIKRVRELNSAAHLCCYGLYALPNEELLFQRGAQTIIGGEFESPLLQLAQQLREGKELPPRHLISTTARQDFRVPIRRDLPSLDRYSRLLLPEGPPRVVGNTMASRGCKEKCRHCPIVPIYNGKFRTIDSSVVLEDIRNQVAAGAEHMTFGDDDFFNGPGHTTTVVQAMHQEHPALTYDVTIKVEHLLRHQELLPVLRDTGCLFVTSAVESFDNTVLDRLNKGHSQHDFLEVVELLDRHRMALAPTFIAFTPWTTLEAYRDFLTLLRQLGLSTTVAPVQLVLRLLLPSGSLLLKQDELKPMLEPFDAEALLYPWKHPDPRMDLLASELFALVTEAVSAKKSRASIFDAVWDHTQDRFPDSLPMREKIPGRRRSAVPYLEEPWYC